MILVMEIVFLAMFVLKYNDIIESVTILELGDCSHSVVENLTKFLATVSIFMLKQSWMNGQSGSLPFSNMVSWVTIGIPLPTNPLYEYFMDNMIFSVSVSIRVRLVWSALCFL